MRLPTGTVTFLFTDIEGSTRLLREVGTERYGELRAEHHRVVRGALERHGAVEVDTAGDGFFAASATAKGAVAAAEEAQRALAAGPVRARIGIHTGEPLVTADGYAGAEVVFAARICAAAHGGQIVVSEATARLLGGDLRDLGLHRLKDFDEPLRLLQLGDGRFPPLRTLSATNLPLPSEPLVGRKKELADVLRLLKVERVRLVTVTGPGGIGKTRFALEAASGMVDDFADGVWFVDLSALRDPELVLSTFASVVGARGDIAEHIRDRELLVVVDNLEQVAEAAADLAGLLQSCPRLWIVATSRQPLHVAGERLLLLRPLAEAPAVELFRRHASAVRPDFDAPFDELAQIVGRLEGVPLALELAAARVNVLDTGELLERLERRLPVLRGARRDAPERQRTLRATIEWSHDLLSPEEQTLFGRLSAFAGGFTLGAAESVCGAEVDALESLIEKNLAHRDERRFSMLETIREFAAERLDDATRRRHAEYFLELAERRLRELRGPGVDGILDELEAEHDNFRAVLDWALDSDAELLLLLCERLMHFWYRRDHLVEADRWLDAALERLDGASVTAQASFLAAGAIVALSLNRLDRAEHLAERSRSAFASMGDDGGTARALEALGSIAWARGDLEARTFFEQALQLHRGGDNADGVRSSLHHLGEIARDLGALADARALLEESLATSRAAGDDTFAAATIHSLGDVALDAGDPSTARARYIEALQIARSVRSQATAASCFAGLAATAAWEGEAATAARLWGAVETIEQDVGHRMLTRERRRYEQILDGLEPAPTSAEDAYRIALSLD